MRLHNTSKKQSNWIPNSEFTETARMYLAIAYQSQFVPGSTDPKSEEMAQKSIATFAQVVDSAKDPANPPKASKCDAQHRRSVLSAEEIS